MYISCIIYYLWSTYLDFANCILTTDIHTDPNLEFLSNKSLGKKLFENLRQCLIWLFQAGIFQQFLSFKKWPVWLHCMTSSFRFLKYLAKIDHFWHFEWTFVHFSTLGSLNETFSVIFEHRVIHKLWTTRLPTCC